MSVSRKAAVRQEVYKLPRTIRNGQVSSVVQPGLPALTESAAVRINCGGAVLEIMNEVGTKVIRAALLAVRGLC